ncbi:MAG: LysR family transcriptional regulator, partial [Alphaproteobacteria bacterium]
MQDLNDLCMYVQVVQRGGFAAAERALGVPKSKLSRRIALLESRLGVRLLQRSSRSFSVTEIGQEYYRHCLAMLIEAEAAQEVIDRSRAKPQGTIRMSCPPALLCFQVGDMVARY